MQGVQQSYALYFNIRYKRTGKVWGQRYESVALFSDSDLIECIKSVEFIPVCKDYVSVPMQYEYSSCSVRILGSDKIVDSMPPKGPVLSEQF